MASFVLVAASTDVLLSEPVLLLYHTTTVPYIYRYSSSSCCSFTCSLQCCIAALLFAINHSIEDKPPDLGYPTPSSHRAEKNCVRPVQLPLSSTLYHIMCIIYTPSPSFGRTYRALKDRSRGYAISRTAFAATARCHCQAFCSGTDGGIIPVLSLIAAGLLLCCICTERLVVVLHTYRYKYLRSYRSV